MPIKPENRKRYPKNWLTEIRPDILERAGHRCEGSPAYPDCHAENGQPHPVTESKVVLTIGHLDHQPENNDPENLRAWCQRCHLTYDAKHHAQNRAASRRAAANQSSFSFMAAALGSRGGKASKRKPGKLRCILLEICNELGSMENHAVFRYWQVHSIAATADNSCDDTCWFKHSIHAKPKRNYDLGAWLGKKDPNDKPVYLPKPWRNRPYDGDYIYHYFDGDEQTTNARTIRSALCRIRCADNRLSVIRAE